MEMFYYYLYLSLKTYFGNKKFGPLNYIENNLDQYFGKIARNFVLIREKYFLGQLNTV